MVHRVPAVEAHSDGTDERVLIEAAQRDPIRFAELYERNFGRVYTFIVRRTRERGEAEDLTLRVARSAPLGLASADRAKGAGRPLAARRTRTGRASARERRGWRLGGC